VSIPVVISLVLSNPTIQTLVSRYAAVWLTHHIGTEVHIGSINLGIRGTFLLKNLMIKDKYDDEMIRVGELEILITGISNKNKEVSLGLLELKDFGFQLLKHHDAEMTNFSYFLQNFVSKTAEDTTEESKLPWSIKCRSIVISNGYFKYSDDDFLTENYKGIDFNDIELNARQIKISKFHFDHDTLKANIKNIELIEKSGFKINSFEGLLTLNPTLLEVDQLVAETNNSKLNADLRFVLNGYDAFSNFIQDVQIDGFFRPTIINLSDIGYFEPSLFPMVDEVELKGQIAGTIADLKAKKLEFNYGKNTSFIGSLNIKGLPEIDTTFFNANIQHFTTNANDLRSFNFPGDKQKVEIPEIVKKLGNINISGTFAGTYNQFQSGLKVKSQIGFISGQLQVNQSAGKNLVRYSGMLLAKDFDLGKLVDSEQLLGKTSFSLNIDGSGLDLETVDCTTKGAVNYLWLNGYNYENINLDGHFKQKQYEGYIAMKDENLDFIFNGLIDLNEAKPVFDFHSDIYLADLYNLKLVSQDSISRLSTNLDINFTGIKLDNIEGFIKVSNTVYNNSENQYQLKNFDITTFTANDGMRSLVLNSDFVDASFTGKFNFSELSLFFNQFLANYSNVLPEKQTENVQNDTPHLIDFSVYIKKSDELSELFLPQLKLSPDATLIGHFHSQDRKLDIEFCADYVDLHPILFENGRIVTSSDDNNFYLDVTAEKVYFGKQQTDSTDRLGIDSLQLITFFRTDSLFYNLSWIDLYKKNLNHGDIVGTLIIDRTDLLKNHIRQFDLLIDGQSWTVIPENEIFIKPKSVEFNQMAFFNNESKLVIDGVISDSESDSLKLYFKDIDISNVDKLFKIPEIDINGILNGNATITSFSERPTFFVNIYLDELYLNDEELGLLTFDTQWDNFDQSLDVMLNIIKKGNIASTNVLALSGNYFPMRNDRNFDFDVQLHNLGLYLVNPFINDFASINQGGYVSGKLRIDGTYAQPVLSGTLNIMRTQFLLKYLNTLYSLTGIVDVNENVISLNSLSLNDTRGRPASVAGNISHNYFSDFALDISIAHNNFKVLNTTLKDNDLFYGNANSSGIFTMKGPIDDLMMEISATTEKGTQIKIPISTDISVAKNNFIIFKTPETEKAVVEKVYDVNLKGLEIDLTVNVTEDAEIELFLPYEMGTIEAFGKGEMGIGVSKRGDFTIFGDYIISKGEFVFTFEELFSRKFDILKGSKIGWRGDPYDGTIDLQATHKVRTSLNGLQFQMDSTSLFNTKVDVLCVINLQNDLFNPDIRFSIDFLNVPETTKEVIYASLDTTDQSAMSQQILSLLILNSFSYTDYAPGLTSNSFNLLSNQINNLLSRISKDFNIGINYQPGTALTEDELEVALSTQLFNNRLSIDGNFGVKGKTSSQNTSNVIGDVNLEYKITDDGRFRIKAFNRTNNLPIIENNAPYTQGIGIFYRREFDHFLKFLKSSGKTSKSNYQDLIQLQREATIEPAPTNKD